MSEDTGLASEPNPLADTTQVDHMETSIAAEPRRSTGDDSDDSDDSSVDSDAYFSSPEADEEVHAKHVHEAFGPATPPTATRTDDTIKTIDTITADDSDLLPSVKGMFRVLDLISEPGSGWLVDKVIISQESLKGFINALSPGVYHSLTRVDFKTLDTLRIQPLGLYGSKSEIIKFLVSQSFIDEATARKLQGSTGDPLSPRLRSGLYLLRTFSGDAGSELVFVIYWPEDTTWNDDAISPVRRNRVTFMRYLMKICDQVACLLSSEHAESIVWDDGSEDALMNVNDVSNRLFKFQVAKTHEQDEAVAVRPGFQIVDPLLSRRETPPGAEAFDLKPRLIAGETHQGFLIFKYIPRGMQERHFREMYNLTKLRSLLETGAIWLNPDLNDDIITTFMVHGLQVRYRKAFGDWKARKTTFNKAEDDVCVKQIADLEKRKERDSHELESILRQSVIDRVLILFPYVRPEVFSDLSEDDVAVRREQFAELVVLYPKINKELERLFSANSTIYQVAPRKQFKSVKQRLIHLQLLLAEQHDLGSSQRLDVIKQFCQHDGAELVSPPHNSTSNGKGVFQAARQVFSSVVSSFLSTRKQAGIDESLVQTIVAGTSDSDFLSNLDALRALAEEPLDQLIRDAMHMADIHLRTDVRKLSQSLLTTAVTIQQDELRAHFNIDRERRRKEFEVSSRRQLIDDMESENAKLTLLHPRMLIDSVDMSPSKTGSFNISGRMQHYAEATLECTMYPLGLTADDHQSLQMNPTFVPSPHILLRYGHVFRLNTDQRILHAQVIENGELLLVTEDPHYVLVFLVGIADIERAVSRHKDGARRTIRRERLDRNPIIAYDEPKRMLCICAPSMLMIYTYVFDEHYTSCQTANTLELAPWYTSGVSISHYCFVCGGEAILAIDSNNEARIFSLVTRQFRPATLTLPQQPIDAYSSPDGACLLLSYQTDAGVLFRAYHWSTFGSSDGIDLGYLNIPKGSLTLTSFVNRGSIHLIGTDADYALCQSVALDITKKMTEFMFKETNLEGSFKTRNGSLTAHNCLIDCHVDVWTRFPVVAAVQRQTIMSSKRLPRKLLFTTDREHDRFAGYFTDLIYSFERTARKPTGQELKRMTVSALVLPAFQSFFTSDGKWDISQFCAGEWLVDLLCMIPIQIAVTRENRFLPLKDGVISASLERDLLGAEVGQIVDALSFGWYESVFQSYMVSKPVKVVSSMGEQSVGKSFSLNHLVDTSFAGSAMRTTEGVWMSATPTNEALIVALDFEGVHSIERTAQEDTLLVLFNTAISNLVLFRNNFAISRSISGLFHSFQSSSTVLDPAANPQLFRSTLVIIIKDVVESDKNEIVREFSTKFQKIVEDEQDANFISRLHAGQLDIIPWPVIESRQFYTLFPALKKSLDRQEVTHDTAGEFLYTLKTLMAKLKANDWAALSQTLAGHRAQKLRDYLSNALEFGFCEMEPFEVPLKNFDTDKLIEKPDTASRFFISESPLLAADKKRERENILASLQQTWDGHGSRHQQSDTEWTKGLSRYLADLVQTRLEHVFEWISSNLSRFKSSHVNMELLRREYESAALELGSNVEICRMTCTSCHLLCILSRHHDTDQPHNCQTSHLCTQPCEYEGDHPDADKFCGYRAGHSGQHICVVEDHLCGEACGLKGKIGCLEECIKVFGHPADEGHICSARVHACGEPCHLKNIKLSESTYSCPRACAIPSDEDHTTHVCDTRSCPMPCDLCKRLCSNPDHLHGLNSDAVHLCGQQHNCPGLCAAEGICQIDTAPQSIEATFTGRHETFQYTKYSQVANRLPCVILIPSEEHHHVGPHKHSTDPAPFHFCETRCESCGYFCTLPRGHTQQEHATNHGSMSKTTWAVDGPDDAILEINGRNFASADDGAPMMCNLVCQEMGRHVHIDYCRAGRGSSCDDTEVEHIRSRVTPNPDLAKDWISHSLFWRRSGFKDPYARDDRANFAKCDAMCPGPEHIRSDPPQPSYCSLPIFHGRSEMGIVDVGQGYLSNDGHLFACKDPADMYQTFHVICVIDKSSSMRLNDRRPLQNTPWTEWIAGHSDNRLGAVYSALHAFWGSRNATLNPRQRTTADVPRDAYSVILFDHSAETCVVNNATSTPEELLQEVARHTPGRGTNFTAALSAVDAVMLECWDAGRPPVVIFLSDGECDVADQTVQSLAYNSIGLGNPLSFHSISFGRNSRSGTLRRMAHLATEIQNSAPHDPSQVNIPSSYSAALDTVRLTETFLAFADSMRKPRGSLLHAAR